MLRTSEGPLRAHHDDREVRETVPGDHEWAWHEVTAEVSGETHTIGFGFYPEGAGRVEVRRAELARRRAAQQ